MKTLLCLLTLFVSVHLIAADRDPLDVYRAAIGRPGYSKDILNTLSQREQRDIVRQMRDHGLWLIEQELSREGTALPAFESLRYAAGRKGASKTAWDKLSIREQKALQDYMRTERGMRWLREAELAVASAKD